MERSLPRTHRPPSAVLVIGGGLAGMYAALAARQRGVDVTLLSKGRTGGSGSSVVAMSVHRFAPDAPGLREDYRQRFRASSAGVQDPEVAAFFVDHAAQAMEDLKAWQLPLVYRTLPEGDGQYDYLACCDPKQGRILTQALRDRVDADAGIRVEDGVTVCDLLWEDGRVQGAVALCGQELRVYPAGAVVLACGGAGNVYAATSNTSDLTGDGYCMAARCGLPLRDMEFVQFYPYRIYAPRRADIFPDIFDHGAVFRNARNIRFMDDPKYPKKELENRDVVARAMFPEEGVHLDLTDCDMDYLERECPNIARMYREFPGQPLLVRPVAHFFMGGISLQKDCTTDLAGLYACGEVTGGLHGANRLAGSALTETVLFGRIAGLGAADYAAAHPAVPVSAGAEERAIADYPIPGEDTLADLKTRLRQIMWDRVSVVRTKEGMEQALRELETIRADFSVRRPADLKAWMQLRNLLFTAEAVTKAALRRPESLGAHYLAD